MERWIKDNASWVAAMVAKHDSWIKDNAVDLYQAAFDGELDEIEQRDKARDGGTENKLVYFFHFCQCLRNVRRYRHAITPFLYSRLFAVKGCSLASVRVYVSCGPHKQE